MAVTPPLPLVTQRAFISLEPRSRTVLHSLYGEGYEKPLATPEEGPAGLLPKLATMVEGIIVGVGPMVEGEARALFTSAATRIFSHLHLRDPSFDLGVLLEPVDPELHDAAAEDPAAAADGKDGAVANERPPQAGDGGVQG